MRYLGSKTKLLVEIEKFIHELDLEKIETFGDGFAGSGSVSNYFSKKYKIFANDYMSFSYYLLSSQLQKKPKFNKIIKYLGKNPINFLNSDDVLINELNHQLFFYNNFSENSGRKYFTNTNAVRIDSIRLTIEQWYSQELISNVEREYLVGLLINSIGKVSNITGTYSAFLKTWDSRAHKKIVLKEWNSKPKYKNYVFNNDIIDFVNKNKVDLLYLDPPYTGFNYASSYHLLETLAKYDYPNLYGISGRRENQKKSPYHLKKKALDSFEHLIKNINSENVIISYSNHGILSLNDFKKIIFKYHNYVVKVKTIPYRAYSNINKYSNDKEKLLEYLIFFKTKKNIKAPINYSGNKFSIINDIKSLIPSDIKKFVDVFGGGFNVGLNVFPKNVVYNDINDKVIDLLKAIKTNPLEKTIKEISSIIKEFKLEKQRETYYDLRNAYNIDKDPLKLLLLTQYGFQYQIRFNSFGNFNNPIGLAEYNLNKEEQLINFIKRMKKKKIKWSNRDFRNLRYLNYSKDTLFYFDPPYLITTATYNDGKRGFNGWNSKDENDLLQLLSKLDTNGYRFILSNVIKHKDKENKLLRNFIDNHNFQVVNIKTKKRNEILIHNLLQHKN